MPKWVVYSPGIEQIPCIEADWFGGGGESVVRFSKIIDDGESQRTETVAGIADGGVIIVNKEALIDKDECE